MTNLDSINPYYNGTQLESEHFNTQVVPDGTGGFTPRGISSRIQHGFVIFIDVLGIKGIWKRKDPSLVIKNWKEIIGKFNDSINNSIRHLKPYSITLSDTIIITCECECNIENIDSIFQSLMQPFIYSISLEFFLRGTISYVMTFLSPQLIIGRSIDEAAEWHNQLEWIGIATTPNLSMFYLGKGYRNRTNNYIYYPRISIKEIKGD